jgi:hypothetical protein
MFAQASLLRCLGIILVSAGALPLPAPALTQGATAAYPDTESLLEWRSRSGFDVLRTKMAGRPIQVPRVHGLTLGYGTIAQPSDEATRIQFPLHLPDFRPMSAESIRRRGAAGWSGGDSIFVVLRFEHRTAEPLKSYEEQFRLTLDRSPNGPGSLALRRYVRWQHQEWFYTVTSDGEIGFIARCTAGPASDSNDFCKATLYLPPKVIVEYTFSKDYLPMWETLDRNMRALVASLFD